MPADHLDRYLRLLTLWFPDALQLRSDFDLLFVVLHFVARIDVADPVNPTVGDIRCSTPSLYEMGSLDVWLLRGRPRKMQRVGACSSPGPAHRALAVAQSVRRKHTSWKSSSRATQPLPRAAGTLMRRSSSSYHRASRGCRRVGLARRWIASGRRWRRDSGLVLVSHLLAHPAIRSSVSLAGRRAWAVRPRSAEAAARIDRRARSSLFRPPMRAARSAAFASAAPRWAPGVLAGRFRRSPGRAGVCTGVVGVCTRWRRRWLHRRLAAVVRGGGVMSWCGNVAWGTKTCCPLGVTHIVPPGTNWTLRLPDGRPAGQVTLPS